ncbi:MAG: thioredoxin domain-containing protein [Candidatus Woesearchaeota archaeon]
MPNVIHGAEELCDVTELETDDQFQKEIKGVDAVVFFMATWCRPCRTAVATYGPDPAIKDFRKEQKIKTVYVDVDTLWGTTGKYYIRGVPTMMAFSKQGPQPLGMQVGSTTPDAVLKQLNEWYKKG